jgi:hypothetical protein
MARVMRLRIYDYDGELPKGRLIVKAKSLLGDVTC